MNALELDRQERLTNRLALDLFLEAAHDEWDRGEMNASELAQARGIVQQISYKLSLGDDFDSMLDNEERASSQNGLEMAGVYQ